MSTPVIAEVDPHDDDAFREWYDVFRAGVTADREAPIITSYDAFCASLRIRNPLRTRVAVAAHVDDIVCGAMLFEYDLEGDEDVVEVDVAVPPQYRQRGVGTLLWAWASERMSTLHRSVAQVELNVPVGTALEDSPGGRFAHARGFRSENVEDHLAMAWPGQPPPLADDATYDVVTWSGAAPDKLVQAYADMRSAMSVDVPTGGLTRAGRTWTVEKVRTSEERNLRSYRLYVALARTHAGEPAGYSLVFVPLTDPTNAIQDDTLVLRSHRGHGLGARLKAANYAQIAAAETGVRWIHTWTAQHNGAMQRVNASFGFAVIEVTHEMEAQPT